MTRVDKSLLYQLEMEAQRLSRLAADIGDLRIQQIADRITYLIAVATGKTSIVDLSAHFFL